MEEREKEHRREREGIVKIYEAMCKLSSSEVRNIPFFIARNDTIFFFCRKRSPIASWVCVQSCKDLFCLRSRNPNWTRSLRLYMSAVLSCRRKRSLLKVFISFWRHLELYCGPRRSRVAHQISCRDIQFSSPWVYWVKLRYCSFPNFSLCLRAQNGAKKLDEKKLQYDILRSTKPEARLTILEKEIRVSFLFKSSQPLM